VHDLKTVSQPLTKTLQGQAIELQVSEYLKKEGVSVLHHNFRCRLGEIDLIGMHQNQLLFVEVRFRRSDQFGGAAASVDYRKQQKLTRTAQFFLLKHAHFRDTACRFDVVAVTLGNNRNLKIDWIQDAFGE
jgi:putative endonuclease